MIRMTMWMLINSIVLVFAFSELGYSTNEDSECVESVVARYGLKNCSLTLETVSLGCI